jgi:hypothetical protein
VTEPKRDRWGRYEIVPEGGGEPVPHTRTTTVAKTLDDQSNIAKWAERHVAKGLAIRPDLLALAASTPLTEKGALNRLCKDAKDAAAAGSRANIGTALHTFSEQVDRGEDIQVPPPWDADIRAYRECCDNNGIDINPEWVEVIAVCDALDEPIAGTIDRIVRWGNAWMVADLKTGENLYFQWRSIAIQLAIYSRASSLYDPQTEKHLPMPEVDQEKAIVFHLPAGEATCTPYTVDLNAGWESAKASVWTRQWRKRDDLATELAA